jgi:hypothetical protein
VTGNGIWSVPFAHDRLRGSAGSRCFCFRPESPIVSQRRNENWTRKETDVGHVARSLNLILKVKQGYHGTANWDLRVQCQIALIFMSRKGCQGNWTGALKQVAEIFTILAYSHIPLPVAKCL